MGECFPKASDYIFHFAELISKLTQAVVLSAGMFYLAWQESLVGILCLSTAVRCQEYPSLIHLEPARSFYKHMWTREGIHTLLEGYDRDYQGVLSMHLWNHLWWSKERRDFSDFHQGRLTEKYTSN